MNAFTDRAVTFSYCKVMAFCLGSAGLLTAIAAATCYLLGAQAIGDALTVLTVPLVGGAAVLRIRAFFTTLHERWSIAFDMGRQVGRQEEQEARDGGVL